MVRVRIDHSSAWLEGERVERITVDVDGNTRFEARELANGRWLTFLDGQAMPRVLALPVWDERMQKCQMDALGWIYQMAKRELEGCDCGCSEGAAILKRIAEEKTRA